MRTLFATSMLCVMCLICGCRKNDYAVKEVKIGGITEQYTNLVMMAIGRLPGVEVKESRIDLATGILEVKHDTMMIRLKNIEYAISDVGFSANEIPAETDPKKVQAARAALKR